MGILLFELFRNPLFMGILNKWETLVIEDGISVPENGCDTAIAFPYSVNGYQTKIEYQDESSKWCVVKYCISPDKKSSIIDLTVLPSDTNLLERKAILVVKATDGSVYNIKH